MNDAEKGEWMKDLSDPTEGMLCSLILAALPRLQHVHVFTRAQLNGMRIEHEQEFKDTARIAAGLELTTPKSLSVSTGPSFVLAKHANITTLALEHGVPNLIHALPQSFLQSVTHLNARWLFPAQVDDSVGFKALLAQVPEVRLSLELDSTSAIRQISTTIHVETIILRPARADAIDWIYNIFPNATTGVSRYPIPVDLRRVELHLPSDNSGMPHLLVELRHPAVLYGVYIIMYFKGKVYRTYGRAFPLGM
ncbi:hypothetical protein CC86DRAFT_469688 [Ophiobolus disseminans]|uniref:Uncharacterized protein n=1 Tax=Ophiobolus disseminans TaxID=1469910 RepID=A0A6A6ZQT0_9PLEO|nr:hypothetical protein CC86DRAFT_469688 [Ophiobolus disseminans]